MIEIRRMEQRYEQAAATSQMAAQAQSSVNSQQGQLLGQGLSGSVQFNDIHTNTGTRQASNSYRTLPLQYDSFYTIRMPERSPFAQAEDFSYGLQHVDPTFIKELVLQEFMYNQFLGMMRIDIEKNPESKKELTYRLPQGRIILKNEKFQFDLDAYMEDAPVKL